ncbi:YwmB family TATA-box binding protein [Paenibacillus glucanolyticus]
MRKMQLQIIVMMLLLCGAAGVMAGFAGTTKDNMGVTVPQAKAVSTSAGWEAAGVAAKSDLELLVDLGEEHMDPSALLTVKIQGEIINTVSADQAKMLADQLARAIGLSEVTTARLHGNEVFHAEAKVSGVSAQLDWALSEEGSSYIRVMLIGEAAEQTTEMMTMQQNIQDEMNQAGIANTWNAAIQGYALKTRGVEETMNQVEESISAELPIRSVEDYADVTTLSRSYEAPSLDAFVMSGSTPIHMQMAVHEDSVKKSNRITIGFPVITIEY